MLSKLILVILFSSFLLECNSYAPDDDHEIIPGCYSLNKRSASNLWCFSNCQQSPSSCPMDLCSPGCIAPRHEIDAYVDESSQYADPSPSSGCATDKYSNPYKSNTYQTNSVPTYNNAPLPPSKSDYYSTTSSGQLYNSYDSLPDYSGPKPHSNTVYTPSQSYTTNGYNPTGSTYQNSYNKGYQGQQYKSRTNEYLQSTGSYGQVGQGYNQGYTSNYNQYTATKKPAFWKALFGQQSGRGDHRHY